MPLAVLAPSPNRLVAAPPMSVCNVADSATIGAVFNNVVTRSEAWVVVVDVVVADVVVVIFVVMVVIIVLVFAVVVVVVHVTYRIIVYVISGLRLIIKRTAGQTDERIDRLNN